MIPTEYIHAAGQAIAILVDAGFSTYGRYPQAPKSEKEIETYEKRIYEIAEAYAVSLLDSDKITPEIIKMTSYRYLQNKVTVWKDGAQIPVSKDLPTAPEFREACIQTWHQSYQRLVIGTTRNELGYDVDHTILVQRNLPKQELENAITAARRSLGLPVSQPSKPMLPGRLEEAQRLIARTFNEIPPNSISRYDGGPKANEISRHELSESEEGEA